MTPSNLRFGTTFNHSDPTTPIFISGQTFFEISVKNQMNRHFTNLLISPYLYPIEIISNCDISFIS
jgi:hypothetical protein